MIAVAVSILSGCTSNTRSMWHTRYAFKSLGEVQGMCDDGDRDACYAAIDLRNFGNGLVSANAGMQAQQAQQIQQPIMQAPTMTTTTCRPIGNSVSCTSF